MSKEIKIFVCAFALVFLSTPLGAQVVDLDQLPWTLNSETMEISGNTSIYTGLRFSQGAISIESDRGTATNGSENVREMEFEGNVVIIVENGRIECDSAKLRFVDSTLSNAVILGTPATYELQRAAVDDKTHAEAGRLEYNVTGGIIEFSGDATITEGGNNITSNMLVYNIAEQRIVGGSDSGAEDDRVRITYTPTAEDAEAIEDLKDDENQ